MERISPTFARCGYVGRIRSAVSGQIGLTCAKPTPNCPTGKPRTPQGFQSSHSRRLEQTPRRQRLTLAPGPAALAAAPRGLQDLPDHREDPRRRQPGVHGQAAARATRGNSPMERGVLAECGAKESLGLGTLAGRPQERLFSVRDPKVLEKTARSSPGGSRHQDLGRSRPWCWFNLDVAGTLGCEEVEALGPEPAGSSSGRPAPDLTPQVRHGDGARGTGTHPIELVDSGRVPTPPSEPFLFRRPLPGIPYLVWVDISGSF